MSGFRFLDRDLILAIHEIKLADNGGHLIADDASALMAMLGLAAGEISESEFAEWIRRNLA